MHYRKKKKLPENRQRNMITEYWGNLQILSLTNYHIHMSGSIGQSDKYRKMSLKCTKLTFLFSK